MELQNSQSQREGETKVTELIRRLQKPDGSPAQFLLNLLTAQCVLGNADGGAILRNGQKGHVDILALYPQSANDVSAPEWLVESAGLAHKAFSSDNHTVKSWDEISPCDDRPAKRSLLMVPLHVPETGRAVAAFLVGAKDETALHASLEKLQLLAGILSFAQLRPTRQDWQQRCRRLHQALETLSAVNREQRFRSAAMAFCNEVASRWQCDRASIGFLKGRYVQLKAMSHTADFSRKMEVVQHIESAMEECLDQDVEILSPAPKESTYIHRASDQLSKRYGPLAVLSVPLRWQGRVMAVLTLERPAERAFHLDEIETVRLACELCTARLANLYEYDRGIGATIAFRLRKGVAALVGPKHTWVKVAAILCFATIFFLICGEGEFRAKAPFMLEATYQQVIPAPFDGYIKSVGVEVGDTVEGGTTVLGDLDTAELRLSLAAAKAEKAGYLKQASAAMRDSETAKAQIAEANAEKTEAQIELLEYQISQASLVSPLGGVVVTGDLKREIGAPVKTGDVLFEVCPLEALRAQLLVPEEDVYDIKVNQEGYLATASYPGQRITFVVERINPIAEVVNQRNIFKVRVQLLETHPWMRPGMEGVAKVSIGQRRYVWMWTRKIINWIRMQLWL
ncbi:MAG: HlyD family efflux transporter periplasmic adaptor subunit [Phycisphaerales bacterium]|nr:MAG: HlyD family efflux transporter periplasmic adaptor subunit [Phycisphaerales bacterium]